MKRNTSLLIVFGTLVLAASLYRVWDGRPLGFAPQIAMAVFAGAIIKDKKWAFIIPVLSMFLSDVLYEVLYNFQLTDIKGFYEGQVLNYVLFGSMTVFGLLIRKLNWLKVGAAAIAAPTTYFLVSNLVVWIGGGGFNRPKTFDGLLLCYNDALPFYRGSLAATVLFSAVFFGGYFLAKKYSQEPIAQLV